MEILSQIVEGVNSFLWDGALLVLLLGTGIFYTINLKFIQVRKFGEGMKRMFGNFSLHGKSTEKGLSSFQALATAIAAQVGTGNIAGAATAIASGGPGAIFWMWVSAFFGMATIYAEAVMAQYTRKRENGAIVGGPVYYIQYLFKGKFGKFLSGFFSVAIILALGFMGNMVQSNSIGSSFYTAFGIKPYIMGIIIAVISAIIFLGGINRIARVTEKIVPLMALVYIVGCVIILIMNLNGLGKAFHDIFVAAFSPSSVLGGAAGVTVQKAMRFGVARGLFSNEAGMGSTPHAHATADVKHPADQGIIAMIGVFIDTFVILTLTALVILSTGALSTGETGSALAQAAFNSSYGSFGNVFIAICMLFFAFTTIIGWYYFGEVNVRHLFGKKAVRGYGLLVVIFVLIGSTLKVDLVWNMSDMFNGLMVIPNLIAILAAVGIVKKLSREHENMGKNQ
ncbi:MULTISPECIES: alanine/glycine:cation symporter family protein [unclassified Blautia]|uniref:alanine/glycine:cation symporter family protein n=1 Tax=unclassified Blautia TaxID=2648079 RepID=UPI000B373381|nr:MULTISPECIES: sodium:alanine symporter family protein [unclassified Blautia]OUN31565.1 sodium:alanine symporter family protein [Blautia sp. An81]OUN93150.1 sodium:alanine symporter family protein [Blautia sp. An46]HJD36393.1 sodium:alanine symporter family protein [Candidatus Blautia ornithocaccae]